jgi:hypothetical protein
MPQLRFRQAVRDDTPEILALINAAFRTPIDASTWEWYVYGNPLGPSRVYLALDPVGAIVGTLGHAPIPLRLQCTRIRAGYAHHLVLDPRYRDTFSYIAFMRHCLQCEAAGDVELMMGPPNRIAYPIHKTLMKWVDFGFLDCLRKAHPASRPHSCAELRRFGSDFDGFYAAVSGSLALCYEKTAPWMNWRFLDRPGSPYTAYVIRAGSVMAGYVVLKRWQDPDGYRKAHIIDLHALDDATLAELVAAAESYGAGCHELNLWSVQGYPYRAALESMGFSLHARQPLMARTLTQRQPEYPNGPCCLSYGDGDSQY